MLGYLEELDAEGPANNWAFSASGATTRSCNLKFFLSKSPILPLSIASTTDWILSHSEWRVMFANSRISIFLRTSSRENSACLSIPCFSVTSPCRASTLSWHLSSWLCSWTTWFWRSLHWASTFVQLELLLLSFQRALKEAEPFHCHYQLLIILF